MLEKFIKKDKNEELEKILEDKKIEEQAKNLLQGILYKVEVSYKDYKKATVTEETEEKYIEDIITNIEQTCNNIKIVRPSERLENEEIQKELEENKFYILNNEIISYPIEEKILFAIEKNANIKRIVNDSYGLIAMPLSNLINTGKNLDKIEVLRDFNGWSWTTIKTEIENTKANLIYQTLKILLDEKTLEDWCKDIEGINDYVKIIQEELKNKYGQENAEDIFNKLIHLAIINEVEQNIEFKNQIEIEINNIQKKIEEFNNIQEKVEQITQNKKEIRAKIKELEKILSQERRIKEEYENKNAELPIEQKIFSVKVFEQILQEQKQQYLDELKENNNCLKPTNYVQEKQKLEEQKELLESAKNSNEQILIDFEKTFLKCFLQIVEKEKDIDNIIKLIYKFRYFMVLPFNVQKNIKEVEELKEEVEKVEKTLTEKAIEKKVIVNVPLDVMKHVFGTRIIALEELYFKITKEEEKYYVQLFDENISEEKFEIQPLDKMKINRKIKIFI